MLPSFYKTSLAIALNAGSADTEVFVNHATTITGETIDWANFSPFTRGTIVVNPRAVRGEDQLPEIISFTGFNSTLKKFTGCSRGRSAITDSQDTDLIVYHPANAEVIITWSGYNIQDILNYVEALIDAATVGTNTNVTATAGETIVDRNLTYLKNDGKWWKTDADDSTTVENVQLGIAMGAGATNGAITNGVTRKGIVTGLSGLVAGTTYYVSNTAGGISSTAGTYSRIIGVALNTTTLYFDPDYASYLNTSTAQKGTFSYAADAGSNDTYVITLSPIPLSYTTGMVIRFKANTANTGAATLNVNSLGAKSIVKDNTRTLTTGDILAGQIVQVVYDGTNFQLMSQVASLPRIIYKTATEVSSTSTSETDLISTTIPGGMLGTNGAISFKMYGGLSFTEDLVLKFYYGSSSFSLGVTGANNSSASGIIEGYLFADSSTSAQKLSMIMDFCESGNEGTNGSTTVALTKTHNLGTASFAIDSTADQTFKMSAQWASSDGDQTINIYMAIIEFLG